MWHPRDASACLSGKCGLRNPLIRVPKLPSRFYQACCRTPYKRVQGLIIQRIEAAKLGRPSCSATKLTRAPTDDDLATRRGARQSLGLMSDLGSAVAADAPVPASRAAVGYRR